MDPQKYQRGYSFSGYQATNPKQPLPGPRVDDELENVEKSVGGLVDSVKDVRRADGQLQNEIVTVDSLSPGSVAYLKGIVQTHYNAAVALLDTASDYLADMTIVRSDAYQARDDARAAATDAAASATLLNAYLYDFNLGGAVADADWND
jgi:hypothetical protein